MLFRSILALGLALVGTRAAAPEKVELRQLNEGNFNETIAKGAWLVEHFSPRCGHCRKFMPTWEELVQKKNYHEKMTGFHMAQVNCLAQGDLCATNNIKFYPQIMLYVDGVEIGEYDEERDYDIMAEWIDDKATAFARNEPMNVNRVAGRQMPKQAFTRPNPEGKVVDVDEAGLKKYKAEGPVLVDFFAPWCPHCVRLRPQYEKLAAEYKGALNIIAVNCDDHHSLCGLNGVRGYPTIKLFDKGEEKEYMGARTYDAMKDYIATEGPSAEPQPIVFEDFEAIVKTEDVYFVHLTTFETSAEEKKMVDRAVSSLGVSVPVFTTKDPLMYDNQNIAKPPPTSTLLSFSSHDPAHIASLTFPATEQQLADFVKMNRHPSLFELTDDNYYDLLKDKDGPLLMLGAVHADSRGEAERAELLKFSRAWKRGGRLLERPVYFVAVDAGKWSNWLNKMVSLRSSDVPRLVLLNTASREYYDITIDRERAGFSGADAFSLIEGVWRDFLKAKKLKSGLGWGSPGGGLMVQSGKWSSDHPFYATGAVVGGVAMSLWAVGRCLTRRRASLHGGYHNVDRQRLD